MSNDLMMRIREALERLPSGTINTLRKLLGEEIWALLPSPTRDAKAVKSWGLLRVVGKDNRNHVLFEVR